MAAEIVMPRLSDSMEEGTILKWLKDEGDEVSMGEELVEIETDKANMTYESDTEGVVTEILAKEGDTLPIGEVIARIGEPGEAAGDGAAKAEEKPAKAEAREEPETPESESDGADEQRPSPAPEAKPADSDTGSTTEAPPEKAPAAPEGDGRIKASPIARRIATERGLDLGELSGSGPGGRIVKADVESARAPERAEPERAPAPAAATPEAIETAKGEVEVVEPSKLQQTVARRMSESKATVPHFQLTAEIDMSETAALRQKIKRVAKEGQPVPSFNDFVIKACARALRDNPRANGAYRDGRFELYSRVNVGMAVAAKEALVVPTVFDADRKTLGEIAVETRQLAGKVRDESITPPELSGGTFTVSNLGMYGIEHFSAVINPPQAGILAVGRVARKPVVDEESGEIVARESMSATLGCDHRILYGAEGAEFLARIRELLEQPYLLAL